MEVTAFQTPTGLHVFQYLGDGPLMVGPSPISLAEARELHRWLGRYLRNEDSKEARDQLADVLEQMKPPTQPAEPFPPRDDLPKWFFVYSPRSEDDPDPIGFAPGSMRHGINSRLVTPEHPQCTHVFNAGVPFETSEANPELLHFVKADHAFRPATQRELQQMEHS